MENSIPRRLGAFATPIVKATTVVTVITLAAMVTVVVAAVIARYVMLTPFPWSEEVAKSLMIWTAYLSISIGICHREHLGVTFLVCRMQPKTQYVVKFITDLGVLGFLWVLTSQSFGMVARGASQIEPATGLTMNYFFMVMPVCGILAIFQHLVVMLTDLANFNSGKPLYDLPQADADAQANT